MSAHRSVPFPGLDIFFLRSFLKIQLTGAVKKMNVNNRVKEHAFAIMAYRAWGLTYCVALFINYRKNLSGIGVVHSRTKLVII
jgi:hypothetical protein